MTNRAWMWLPFGLAMLSIGLVAGVVLTVATVVRPAQEHARRTLSGPKLSEMIDLDDLLRTVDPRLNAEPILNDVGDWHSYGPSTRSRIGVRRVTMICTNPMPGTEFAVVPLRPLRLPRDAKRLRGEIFLAYHRLLESLTSTESYSLVTQPSFERGTSSGGRWSFRGEFQGKAYQSQLVVLCDDSNVTVFLTITE